MSRPDPVRFAQARAHFEEIADLPSGARTLALSRLRNEAPDLAATVEELLAADDAAGDSFLAGSAAAFDPLLVGEALAAAEPGAQSASPPSPAVAAGDRVGPYQVRELLGRGGMGEVWEAGRADGQFDQTVALKLLKRGMDSEEVLRRFLRERQILARLEHPNIARLLDGGLASDGRPYLVLERVHGAPIVDWCASRHADLATRLRLVIAVAEAVDLAHRNLVVHRDLKPSNLLVDDSGTVKLLDFGIAKILTGEEAAGELTRLEDRALTPAYAAPEQILGRPATTATDVYSLGVVLFELLTGKLPHTRSTSSQLGLAQEVERETLTRPSRVVAESGNARAARALTGDLDTIAMKALAREPERRYGSIAALAEDLRRYLDGRPVMARPDNALYRAGKFVSRHRLAAGAAALVAAALVFGLSLALWQARRAERNALTAAANAQRAERVKEFLIGLFEVADPEQSGGNVPARELLEQAGKRLETELAADPLIRAELLEAVARIDRSLGLLEPAASLAEKSLAIRLEKLPAGHSAIAASRATLGNIHVYEGKLEAASTDLEAAVHQLEASEPPQSLLLARVRSDYASALFWKGRAEESEKLERQVWQTYARELGPDDLQTAIHLRNLAVVLDELDRLDEAEKAYRDSQATVERVLGPDHPNTAASYVNLAVLLERRGKLDEAEALLKHALAIRREKLGGSHTATGQSLQLYALFLMNRGRDEESEAIYREARALFAAINPRHFEVGKCDNGLAILAGRRGDHASAERLLLSVVDLFREQLGDSHKFVWQVKGNLAREIAAQKRYAEAEAIQRTVAAKLEEITGPKSDETADALANLAQTVIALGRQAEAAPLLERASAIRTAIREGRS
ncbi:MAG: serine/threonine-protein kinase [Thermoanaerobaculia bacterium]